MLGSRVPAETLRRFWTMLAHNQGQMFNASRIGGSLGVSGQTTSRYLDLLVNSMLVRQLQPCYANVGKRLVKSPKTFIRDSGILHSLLNIQTLDDLLSHPVLGSSWEGLVIDNLQSVAPPGTEAFFYRTAAGTEIDLVLSFGGPHNL
jgi:predicted AAA+ superfamily ATPase